MDKIVSAMHQQDGVIIGCPTYDLMPSSFIFALCPEISFARAVLPLKNRKGSERSPSCGRCYRSRRFLPRLADIVLECIGATMFTQSVKVVDQMMSIRNGRPGNVLLRPEQIERAHKLGENIVKSVNTPFEERTWLGDPIWGLVQTAIPPLCLKLRASLDGIQFPFECAVCGAGGDPSAMRRAK